MDRDTELPNPLSRDLDLRATDEILFLINAEDQGIAPAVRGIIPTLARAVDETAARLRAGGRVFYTGAGTSGRLGVLDAAEIPPTFGVDPELFQAILAGGQDASQSSMEASEDDTAQGARDLRDRGCRPADVVVGITASGETPYTLGALTWARSARSLTIAICCDPAATAAGIVDFAIAPEVGPEIIAGSTRMKAGTAQKLVLNMFSTGVMVRLGSVYSHWMISVQMKNSKLRERGLRILEEITGKPESDCREALAGSEWDLRVALVMLLCGCGPAPARARLQARGWDLRAALADIAEGEAP